MAESTNWIATVAAAVIGLLSGYATKVLDLRSSQRNKDIDHQDALVKMVAEQSSGYTKILAEQVITLTKQLEENDKECNERLDNLNAIIRQLHQTNAEQQAEINYMKRHIDNLEKRIGST